MILNNADNIMCGSTNVDKIMCGSNEIWIRTNFTNYEHSNSYTNNESGSTEQEQTIPIDREENSLDI